MPQYRYLAKNQKGRTFRRMEYAESETALIKSLHAESIIPIKIRLVSVKTNHIRLGMKDTRELSSMLALLLEAGHSVPDALDLVVKVKGNNRVGKACELWARELSRGTSFRKALENSPVTLPASFQSLTGIGETVGSLGKVLKQLEDYYGRLAMLREKLGTALIYPCLVLVVAIIVGIIIATVILPKMTEMMISLNPNAVISENTPGNLKGAGILFLLFIVFIPVLFLMPKNTALGKWRAKMLLNLPVAGPFIRDWGLLGWSFALEILTAGGVPMNQSLTEAAGAVGNPRLENVLADLSGQLGKGHSLASLLRVTPHIPNIVPSWVSIGEKTGKDTEVFKPIRKYFEDKVSRSIDLATQLMEPILILALGGGMVFFVLRYLMPFFRMMGDLL